MARQGESSFAEVLLRVLVIAAVIYAGFEFLSWDESEKDQGVEFIAPYALYYRYQGEDKGFENAQSWHVKFDLSYIDPSLSGECDSMLSQANYRLLNAMPAHQNNHGLVFNPVWVFHRKLANRVDCEVNNLFKQQPDENMVRQHNTLTWGKYLVAQFEKTKQAN